MPISVPSLRYVNDDEPGLRRRRAGRGFAYSDAEGRTIRDPSRRARIRALAIPPAWTDVWICPDEDGHIQATGRDARGRKQYRYHADWRTFRDRAKFEHLRDFGAALPAIRRAVAHDMARPEMSWEKVVATIVRLLELSLIRVGNEEYARDNKSYGLTTLRASHAHVNGGQVELAFRGKSGKMHRTSVADPRVAQAVRRLQDLPGQNLFQYVDADGSSHTVGSADVNRYLRATSGADVTAKEYRTWAGSVLAATGLATLEPPASPTEARHEVAAVMDAVSRELGNTPAVCRASYVHPAVVEAYEDGSLPERWARGPSRASRHLAVDERRLLALLRSQRTRRRAPRPAERAA